MLRLITGRTGCGKTARLYEIIKEKIEQGEEVTLIVPEQYSFHTEKKMLELLGAKGADSVEVVSFSFLAKNLLKKYGLNSDKALDDSTRAIIMSVALDEIGDRLQVFGVEFAKVLWKFNCRGEFAYNLTSDVAGDDPWVKNNSLAWVGGFDIDLPVHNLNINVQETGTYVLKNDKIEDGAFKAYDVDYNSDGKYCINKVVVNVSDKWINEKLSTECMVIYGIENKEWCVQPKIEYNVVDGFTVIARGAYLYSDNENGEFYNFTADSTKNHTKAFAQFSVKYVF